MRKKSEAVSDRLRRAINDLHGSGSVWIESVQVRECFAGKPVWEGEVHVFRLIGHPSAQRCYAWLTSDEQPRVVAVLHLPPVDSPVAAVRASIVADFKGDR